MNSIDLETKIEGLKKAIAEHKDFTGTYESQLVKTEQQLKDYNKIALPPVVFDDIYEAIEAGVGEFDFSDTDNFELEYGIDYDGRVNLESHEFKNPDDLIRMIAETVSKLFVEATEEEPENEKLEKPVETQPVVEKIPETEECDSEVVDVDGGETEVTVTPTDDEMKDFNEKVKEKSFRKRTWFK